MNRLIQINFHKEALCQFPFPAHPTVQIELVEEMGITTGYGDLPRGGALFQGVHPKERILA